MASFILSPRLLTGSIFANSIIGQGEEQQLSMPPSQLQEFITARDTLDRLAEIGEFRFLLTRYQTLMSSMLNVSVLSYVQNEIHPKARIKTWSYSFCLERIMEAHLR